MRNRVGLLERAMSTSSFPTIARLRAPREGTRCDQRLNRQRPERSPVGDSAGLQRREHIGPGKGITGVEHMRPDGAGRKGTIA